MNLNSPPRPSMGGGDGSSWVYYALVSYGRMVLCDSCFYPGSYDSLCQTALDHMEMCRRRRSKKKNTYKDQQRKLRVFVFSSQGLDYVAVCSLAAKKSRVFEGLARVEEAFQNKGLSERAYCSTPYALRHDFSEELKSILCNGEACVPAEREVAMGGALGGVADSVFEAKHTLGPGPGKWWKIEKADCSVQGGEVYKELVSDKREKSLHYVLGHRCPCCLV